MVNMNFPNYFADANSSFDKADFIIYGVPYDRTSSFRRGADQAPGEIRQASWNFETYDIRTGVDLRNIRFHDYGDLDVKDDSPKDMVQKVREFTTMLLEKNKFPVVLGGEHSITPGVVQAFSKKVAVLSLDAHLDFRDEYENERFNHACVTRRIVDHVNIKDVVVFGFRSAEKEELEDAKNKGLLCFDSFAIRETGIKKVLDETKKRLGNKRIYLTLDIDVVDPAYAPGTSTPEPFGLTPLDILTCIDFFSPYLIGFDIVEACPTYDNGETALLAAKLLRCAIGNIWKNKNHD